MQEQRYSTEQYRQAFQQYLAMSHARHQAMLAALMQNRLVEDVRRVHDPPMVSPSLGQRIISVVSDMVNSPRGGEIVHKEPLLEPVFWQMSEPIVIRGSYYVLDEDGNVLEFDTNELREEKEDG